MGSFPVNDTFREEASPYGERLASYIRHLPWLTAGDGASGFAIPNTRGDLHNGYSGGFNIGSFKSQTDSGATASLGALLWRQAYLAETRVGLIFRNLIYAGSVVADDFRWVGVCARVTGGTFVETVGQHHVKDTSGYWFILGHLPGDTRWVLLRVNSGVVTKLADKVCPNSVLTNILSGGHTLQMEVTNESGNVRINTFYDGATAVASHLDTSGSKITGAGRAGFGMCRDRQLTTPTRQIATLGSRFTVFDLGVNQNLLADDMTRINSVANALIVDGNGRSGRILQSMWTLDAHGINAYSGGSTQYRDSGFDRIDARGGNHNFSQIAASDPVTQARSIVFRRTNDVAYVTNTGIMLRGSIANAGTAYDAYLFTITYVGAVYSAVIRRFNAGVTTLIATADVTTGYGLTNGVDFQLLASVRNEGAIPQLVMQINGSSVSGWTFLASGATAVGPIIQDGAANAIQSGPAQAIQIVPYASTADGHIYYKLWTDEVPPDIGASGGDEDEPSLLIGTEVDGKTGVHSMPIGSEFDVERRGRIVEQRYESEHVARVNFATKDRRLWRIEVAGASSTERQDLWDFWNLHGKSIPFDFVDPESPTQELVAAHFFDDSLATVRSGPLTSSFAYVVEELFPNDNIQSVTPGSRVLRLTGHAPTVMPITPPSNGMVLRLRAPIPTIAVVPAHFTLTYTGYPPTAP